MAQRPSRGRTECTRNRGFAAILSVVLVSGIALIASVAVAANYIIQSREITDRIFAIQARSSANSCAYIALLRLKLNNSYNGNEDISVDKVICRIESVVANGVARTVYATATVSGYASRVKVEITDVSEFFVNSWREIPPT
jgi:hypothetical protein